MTTKLPNCPSCGGERTISEFDQRTGTATIKEVHSKECALVKRWEKVVGSKGIS